MPLGGSPSGRLSSLVAAMTSDGWSLVRSRLGRLLGRGDARAEAAALDTLDEDAQAMAGASGDTAAVAQ